MVFAYSKVKRIIGVIPVIVLLAALMPLDSLSQAWITPENNKNFNLYEVQKNFNDYWKDKKITKGSGWKVFKRLEWFWEQRLYPTGQIPDFNMIYNDYTRYMENQKSNDQILVKADWKPLGPTTKPQKKNGNTPVGMGRVNCIAFDPTNSSNMWVGAAFAGVWKTTDAGTTWTTFAQTDLMSVGVSDLAISPTSPNTVYAATGDAESGGFFGQNFSFSIGILKTTDGGSTWNKTGLQSSQSNTLLINRLLIHPTNDQILYAGTNAGVYKTIDGGNNWTQITTEYCRDLEFKPGDPTNLYGAMYSNSNGVYSVKLYTEASNVFTKQIEFPANEVSRLAIAVTKANSSYAYILAAGADMGFHSVWRTTNGGSLWVKMADKSKSPNYLSFDYNGGPTGGQGMYDLSLAVSQTAANEVYLGGVNIWKSTDGGAKFDLIAEWTGDYGLPWVHADIHSLQFSPTDVLFATSDGGVEKSTNNGVNWKDISDGLGIMQFYRLATSKTDGDFIIAGAQDNGTNSLSSGQWKNIQGGDGMECLIDYTDSRYVYASLYYGELTRSSDGGSTFSDMLNSQISGEVGGWVTPMIMHPTDPKILYAGLHNIWKTTDRGDHWGPISSFQGNGTFRAMAIAPSNPNYIYAAAYNQLLISTNGGSTWNMLYQPNQLITYIAVDPKIPSRIWITLSGYQAGYKIFKYENSQWTNVTGTLPNVPVNCIVYQNDSPDRLYAGTDAGVFMREKTSSDWVPFNDGMPPVVVNELEIHYGVGKLRAATYARGIWETKLSDCNLSTPDITITGKTTLCAGDTCYLDGPAGFVSYQWSNGQNTKKIAIGATGSYTLTVTDAKSCTAVSNPVSVSVTNPPDIVIAASKNPFCEGDSVQLSGPSLQYSTVTWSNGAQGRKIWVKAPGSYTATGTTSGGCSKTSKSFDLQMTPKPAQPVISLNGKTLESTVAQTYQWYFNNLSISGATQKTYTPTQTGNYQVEITDASGCSNISTSYFFQSDDVKDNFKNDYVTLTPNPTQGVFTLKISGAGKDKITISITNLLGAEVFRYEELPLSSDYTKQIDLSHLPSTTYFIKITSNNLNYFNSIIKEK